MYCIKILYIKNKQGEKEKKKKHTSLFPQSQHFDAYIFFNIYIWTEGITTFKCMMELQASWFMQMQTTEETLKSCVVITALETKHNKPLRHKNLYFLF